MNVIPKLQQGGSLDAFFTEYVPLPVQKRQQQEESRGRRSSADSQDTDKGKLTEKDLFNMLKDINGLPNEMRSLIDNLLSTFQIGNITGAGINDLATTYLSNLYQIKVAQQNKTKFDEAMKAAVTNGSLQETAILGRNIMVQTEDGKIQSIPWEEWYDNKEKYSKLTVSNIGYLRQRDPRFVDDQSSFEVISGSVGYQSFQKAVDLAKATLGTYDRTRNGYFSAEGQASKGLELIGTLQKDDRVQAIGSVTAEGLYEYKIIDKDQAQQIKALTSYMLAILPEDVKTWAADKLNMRDRKKATESLVLQYLISGQDITHTFDITYHGSMDHAMGNGKGKSGSGKEEDPKEGFWRQVQSGKGGDDSTFYLLVNRGNMHVDGKFHGATPGPNQNCSLGDYIAQSGVGFMIKNNKAITFGDVKLSQDSFDDVMVNQRAGAYVVTLPVKEGKVWLEAVEVYSDFNDELKRTGYTPGSEQYINKAQSLLKEAKYSGLAPLIGSNGQLKPSNSGQFLVLEGLASSKTYGVSEKTNKKWSFDDIRSNFILNAGDDDELFRVLEEGLSNKDRGDYSLDNNWAAWNNDKIYRGNIYIPLTTNPLDAMNADGNEVKQSTAKDYEEAQQIWNKRNTQGNTGSNALIQ